jgi:hypothetical protein
MLRGLQGQAINQAGSQLDSLTGNAHSILANLVDQSSSLKGVQRKVQRVAHVLSCVAVQRKVQ